MLSSKLFLQWTAQFRYGRSLHSCFQARCVIRRLDAGCRHNSQRLFCTPPSGNTKNTGENDKDDATLERGSSAPNKTQVSQQSSGLDQNDKKLDLMEFARSFEPEEDRRQEFPTNWLGSWKMHRKIRVSLMQRYLANASLRYIRRYLDQKFDVEDFMTGAKMAYKIIRHVVANSRKADDLDLLDGIVCPKLLQTMRDSVSSASVTERNLGLEVHDIYCEVIQPKIRLEAYEKMDEKSMSWKDAFEHRNRTLQRGEWMQIKVRFLALENVFLNTASGSRTSIRSSMNPSTWTFQGKVWNLDTSATRLDSEEPTFYPRVQNPDLCWQLIAIEYL